MSFIQRTFNNDVFSIERISNEICYDFISLQSIDLLKNFVTLNKTSRTTTANVIVMIQMYAKNIYDFNHKELSMNVENWAFLRLHKDYEISFIIVLKRKLSQQYVKLFKKFQKINTFAYKLNISHEWKIWSVIFIAQFELSSASDTNSFKKIRDLSSSISMKDDLESNNVKSFEIKKIIVKKLNRKKNLNI